MTPDDDDTLIASPSSSTLWHPYHMTSARLVSSYLNLLLIFFPLGVCAALLGFPPLAVFALNLLAIVPLTAWITFSIGQLSSRIGRVGDELLKATLGNPIEVSVGLSALRQGQTLIVQRAVIGNILLYSLLVLGCCIFVVGGQHKRVKFDRTSTNIMLSLTTIVVISLIIPTIMLTFPPADEDDGLDDSYILRVSHAAATVLFLLSLVFFYFQFYSHPHLFHVENAPQSQLATGHRRNNGSGVLGLNRWITGVVLIAATSALVVCVNFLIRGMDDVSRTLGISSAFLVTVLVPLIGNGTKIVTILAVAKRNPIDLAIRAIINTNLRLLMLIMPALVLVGWVFDQPLTLQFDLFDATILFLAIMVMNYLIQDGRSNYLEGLVLMGTYVIVSVAFEVRPMAPDDVIYLPSPPLSMEPSNNKPKRGGPMPADAAPPPIITISTADLSSPQESSLSSPITTTITNNEPPSPDSGGLQPAATSHSLFLSGDGSSCAAVAGRPRVTSVTSLSDGETMVASSSQCGSCRTRSTSEVTAISMASDYQKRRDSVVYNHNFHPSDDDHSSFGIAPDALDALFAERSVEDLFSLGGVSGLAYVLRSDRSFGIRWEERPDCLAGRVKTFGGNRLPEKKMQTLMQLMWNALQDRVLILLTVVATVSLALGLYQTFCQPHRPGQPKVEWVEGATIMAAVVVVVVVSGLNDYQKERQFATLNRKKEDRTVTALRSGKPYELSVYDVVVGDLLHLEAGDLIPADGILVSGHNIRCDESSISGESDPKKKIPGDEIAKRKKQGVPLGKQDPFIVSGCKVVEGIGTYMVTAVGERSTYGRTMMSLVDENEPTPLQQKLATMADQIAIAGITAAVLLFVVLSAKFLIQLPGNTAPPSEKGQAFLRIVIVSIAVVVIAVPEGLPLAVTLALAIAVTRMLKDNNLVRILSSCETMGSVTTVCSDKTGTLTMNQMTVVAGTVGMQFGFGNRPEETEASTTMVKLLPTRDFVSRLSEQMKFVLSQSIVINSTAVESEKDAFIGSRTEMALLSFAKQYLSIHKISEERANAGLVQMVPFDSERKCMASVVNLGGIHRLYIKGAPEVLLEKCSHIVVDASSDEASSTNAEPLSKYQDRVPEILRGYSKHSLRMIGFAYRDFPSTWPPPHVDTVENDPTQAVFEDIMKDMTFLGIFGIQDPLRPGVTTAIAKCRNAGVSIKMVTGDNIDTANAIATQSGILDHDGISMDGPTFRKLSKSELYRVLPRLQVLARSSPEDKQNLVKGLKELDEVVAVTGDGTNDAPALTVADVGFSMGVSGTDIALEASSIILMDDNFSSIVRAIEWGRTVNDAIKKFLQFQLTVNITAVALTFITAITSDRDESILTPVQLLWVNLIMDTFAAMALATDPPHKSILEKKPQPKSAPMISLTMWKMIIAQSIYQLSVTLALNFAGNEILGYEGAEQESLETVVFNTFVWMQFFNQYNNRRLDNRLNIFEGIHENWYFLGINLITIVGQVLIIFFGGSALSAVRLDGTQWAISLFLGAFSLVVGALVRLVPDRWLAHLLVWHTRLESAHPDSAGHLDHHRPDESTPLLGDSRPRQTHSGRMGWIGWISHFFRAHTDTESV
ncbi:hypothetical protein UA08_06274 [Talaromyces atroroseus]|uniref:Calcium-transporting ATPase n=1 Tax=Talaromyces atroroseus TaxID=1441469 RepID=A0A225ADI5_TALAT|nr:hypothetical protein UA08_06274 [Talaromyces atroroseus]OKL58510.1 hypothetical protein UA08_06274 [Talaromyces atroroseus]